MAHLTNATDAHVQGVSIAARPIQYLGCQFHDHILSLCVTLEGAGGSRIVILWKPFVIVSLVLDVIVGGALLGSEVLCVGRAVLGAEKKGHMHRTW